MNTVTHITICLLKCLVCSFSCYKLHFVLLFE